jgi:transcriptional regulator with XRE-family HTH domain
MAKSKNRFGKKLTKIRNKRGWSVYQACTMTNGLKRESLSRLEDGRTDPEKATVKTMFEIVHLYRPDIAIGDFTNDKTFKHYQILFPTFASTGD